MPKTLTSGDLAARYTNARVSYFTLVALAVESAVLVAGPHWHAVAQGQPPDWSEGQLQAGWHLHPACAARVIAATMV
jgi:hypothetical protein